MTEKTPYDTVQTPKELADLYRADLEKPSPPFVCYAAGSQFETTFQNYAISLPERAVLRIRAKFPFLPEVRFQTPADILNWCITAQAILDAGGRDIGTPAQTKQQAARQVHEWFVQNPEHWKTIARRLFNLHIAAEADYKRLNPTPTHWPPRGWKEKQTELFDPFLFFVADGQANPSPIKGRKNPLPDNPEHCLLIYYAACICLHDATEGYERIGRGIWPTDNPLSILTRPGDAFLPHWGDKTPFVEAALLAVRNDLNGQSKTDNQPKTILSKEAQKILSALSESKTLLIQQDIKAITYFDRKTISRELKSLLDEGFIEYPNGKKKGAQITLSGREFLKNP